MKNLKRWGMGIIAYLLCIGGVMSNTEASTLTAGKAHIGTFNGSTTFRTSSSNGINPGLFIEVRDAAGNLKQYTSDDGVVTVENTKEGAYVTQAKLLGKTKYVDQETGEVLDQWEAGRNLKLESSKMPVLTTFSYTNLINENDKTFLTPYLYPNKLFYKSTNNTHHTLHYYNADKVKIGNSGNEWSCKSQYQPPYGTVFVKMEYTADTHAPMLGYNNEETYKPFTPIKSNILTVNEDVELRGIGDVRDTLDCLTGVVTERIGEIVLDGNESYTYSIYNQSTTSATYRIAMVNQYKANTKYLCDKLPSKTSTALIGSNSIYLSKTDNSKNIYIELLSNITGGISIELLKEYLKSNPIIINFEQFEKSVKTVDLRSTHQFDVISDAIVQVKGDILPTIYSVTVPSEPLTFAINPNAEEGQQFIAPDFKITNEGKGPVFLELKAFEQSTDVLNDVLPDKYEDWSLLTKDESKDIALALVPMKSEGWLSFNEGPKYVANNTNIQLGSIKPGASVDFSFSAYHGRIFEQNLFPEYRLVFTFGF